MTLDGDQTAAPAIVMVSSGTQPTQLVLPPNAELGRRIAIEGGTHDVPDERMSRDHAVVRWDRGTWIIKDLDSRNGTYVNGERALGEARRRGDTVLRLGHTVFILLANGRGHGGGLPDNPELVVGPELARAHAEVRGHATAPTLLVQGESGTGKQLAAKLWHDAGPRAAGPFVAIACGAIPEGVADRLVFGSKKGAIETIGHYQMARGGTLVLGDLGGLDPTAQARLVKLLGADGEKPGLVATGHELRSVVADGRLREDLYQIFARTLVTLPPLRARKVDVARIVQLEVAAAAAGAKLVPHAKLVETCCVRGWPGNVRELRSTIKFAALEALAEHKDVVRSDHMAAHAGVSTTISGQTAVERRNPAIKPDRDILIAAIARANGDISIAARGLNMHRDQLKKLLEEYGIVPDEG